MSQETTPPIIVGMDFGRDRSVAVYAAHNADGTFTILDVEREPAAVIDGEAQEIPQPKLEGTRDV